MHRVELKGGCGIFGLSCLGWFLMHRVELKEFFEYILRNILIKVPNAPCGVESDIPLYPFLSERSWFLMHRVELKVNQEELYKVPDECS